VGSKSLPESYILAEIVAQIIDDTGEARAERRLGLGGSGIVHGALAAGHIDVYPEYTGTIAQAILKEPLLVSLERCGPARHARTHRGRAAGLRQHVRARPSVATRPRVWACERSVISPATPASGRLRRRFLERAEGGRRLQRHYGLRFATSASWSTR